MWGRRLPIPTPDMFEPPTTTTVSMKTIVIVGQLKFDSAREIETIVQRAHANDKARSELTDASDPTWIQKITCGDNTLMHLIDLSKIDPATKFLLVKVETK